MCSLFSLLVLFLLCADVNYERVFDRLTDWHVPSYDSPHNSTHTKHTPHTNITLPGHDHDSDNEEDDYGFEPSGISSRASVRHKNSANSVYGARLVGWFDKVMSLLKLYSTCPTALNMAFEKHCKEVKHVNFMILFAYFLSLFCLLLLSIYMESLFLHFLFSSLHHLLLSSPLTSLPLYLSTSLSFLNSSASCGPVPVLRCPNYRPSSALSWPSLFCRCVHGCVYSMCAVCAVCCCACFFNSTFIQNAITNYYVLQIAHP